MERAERFIIQSYISFKALFGWLKPKSYIFIKLINPVFQMLFFCIIAKFCYQTNDLTPYIVGNSILLCVHNCVFGLGNIFISDRYSGTLKIIIASPFSKFPLFIERGIVHIFDSLSSVVLGIVFGGLILGVNFSETNPVLLAVVIVTAMFAAACFGLLLGTLGLITSEMHLVLNISAMTLLAFSGANFPTETLPRLLQPISQCLPITRSISASKILLNGGAFADILGLLAGEIGIGIIFVLIGFFIIKMAEAIARKKGTLDLF